MQGARKQPSGAGVAHAAPYRKRRRQRNARVRRLVDVGGGRCGSCHGGAARDNDDVLLDVVGREFDDTANDRPVRAGAGPAESLNQLATKSLLLSFFKFTPDKFDQRFHLRSMVVGIFVFERRSLFGN